MTRSRLIVSLAALAGLTAICALPRELEAQLEQSNNYTGGGANNDFDNQDNWNSGGPDDWTPGTGAGEVDLNEGGISFDLGDDLTIDIDVAGNGYENMGNLHILSRTAVHLIGTGTNTFFEFGDNDEIRTGDGALWLDGIDLHLQGDFEFNYGNGDEDDPAETFDRDFGTQTLQYNLIIDGVITDDGEGLGDATLTFSGNGFALLTGGIVGGGTGDDGDEDRTQWELSMESAASLMLAGGADYFLAGGVSLNYSGGSVSGRENGHGILQVADGATLDTTSDGSGGGGDGNITLDGYSALLIGSINLENPETMEELEELGFRDNVATDAGSGTVRTNDVAMAGSSVVIVGDGSITGEELTMAGSTTFMIQDAGTATFDSLEISSSTARFVNYGTATFNEAVENFGTMVLGGTTNVGSGFASSGTLEIVNGGNLNITDNAAFGGTTTVETGGGIRALADFGIDGSMEINGGTVEVGTYDEADLNSAELNGSLTISGTGTFISHSNTSVAGNVFIDGGSFRVGDDVDEDAMEFELATSAARFGGHGNLDIYNDSGFNLNGGTLFVGGMDDDNMLSVGTLVVSGGDIDAQGSTLEFAVSGDPLGNSQLDLTGSDGTESNTVTFDGDSTIALAVSGESYIANDTVFELILAQDKNGDIINWDELTIEQLEASNSVTRFFDFVRDQNGEIIDRGSVTISADYFQNAGQYQDLAGWLNTISTTSAGGGLVHQFDQLGSSSAYQFSLRQLQPVTLASGLQVVSDTQQFNVLREAVEGMKTQRFQGRPGPARRPLGQMSESLLASQDEGDAVRSRYGYGIGPDSGARRSDSNDIVAFAQGYGRSLSLDNKGSVLGLSGNDWGIVAGAAGQLSNEWMLGVIVGYDSFSGTLNDNAGSVDVSTIRAGPFASWSDGSWIVDVAVAGAWNDWRGTQNTGLGGMPSYDWSTHGYQIDGSAGLGYSIPVGGGIDLIPEGSLVYSWIHTNSYTGTNGQYVDTDDLNAIIARLGARAQFNVISGLVLEGRLGWQGNYTFGGEISTGFSSIATPIPSTVDAVDRNNIYYGAQVTWMPRWDLALTLRYEGRSGDGTNDQYIAGGFSIEF